MLQTNREQRYPNRPRESGTYSNEHHDPKRMGWNRRRSKMPNMETQRRRDQDFEEIRHELSRGLHQQESPLAIN